jgi:hypothetical protein
MTETPEKIALMEAVVEDPAAGAHVTPELQQAFDDGTPLKGGDRPEHPRILEAREAARSGWKWDKIVETIEQQKAAALARGDGSWDEDDCEEVDRTADAIELATFVYLGSYVITPSGKVYTPFATSNLDPCPECDGTGVISPEKYTARDRLYLAEAERLLEMDYPGKNTPEWSAYIARKNALNRYGLAHSCRGWKVDCNLCNGDGRHEPEIDTAWYAEMELQANERGLFFDCRESDNGYQIGATFTIPIPKETSMIIIKYTAPGPIDVEVRFTTQVGLAELVDDLNEIDEAGENLAIIDAEVEHRAPAEGEEETMLMRWFKAHLTAGPDSLSNLHSLITEIQETIDYVDGDTDVLEAYCALCGEKYLNPGERVHYAAYTKRELIERELERLDLGRKVYDKIRHLIDDAAVLAQAEQGDDTVEYKGKYYVFDN